jgi:Ca-activated chloride channel homolog
MKQKWVFVFLFFVAAQVADAQYYFRGEIKNAKKEPLPYVRIHVHSTNSFYYSGSSGSFGIPSAIPTDTVTLLLSGYEEKKVVLTSSQFNYIDLKASSSAVQKQRKKLLSVTKDKVVDRPVWWSVGGETYLQQVENEFNNANEFPTTGFAMNVDKASYSNIRRFINMKSAVPPDAVRIEEMLNYFPQQMADPPPGKIFSFESQLTGCPWAPANQLLFLKLHAKKLNFDHLPPGNFVFLIDVSGSMELPNRLPLLKTAFRMLVQNLRAVDTISIVVYGGTYGIMLQPTSGKEKEKIINVIDSLEASGDTPGESAIRMAYNLAEHTFIKGGNNRIILATDGDFNVGEVSEDALMQLVVQKQQTGIYLTCLGVGMGNYKDSKLEILAKKGNGNFAYLDNVMEAEKVLVTELTQTLFSVANETFLNVSFNSQFVKQYRLIGYENRKDLLADSTASLEGGEIGSGHTVTAVFEIVPTGNRGTVTDSIATAELTFEPTGTKNKVTEHFTCIDNFKTLETADSTYRFSSAVVLFGLLLKQSASVNTTMWDVLLKLLPTCVNSNNPFEKEMQALCNSASVIYKPVKTRKQFLKKRKEK